MKRSWWYRFLILLFMAVFAVMAVIPTVFDFKETDKYPIKSKISLGLDLQGGLYMILGIDFNKVYRDEVKGYARKLELALADEGMSASVGELNVEDIQDPKHSIVLGPATTPEAAKIFIRKFYGNLIRLTHEQGQILEYGLSKIQKSEIEKQSVTKSIEVIRNRIDEFGVTEPEILSQGKDRIIVALPGVKDIDRAKDLIGKTAKLEFKMVHDEIAPATLMSWVTKANENGINYVVGERFSEYVEKLNVFLKSDIPKGQRLVFQKTHNKLTNKIDSQIPFLVEDTVPISGEDIEDARTAFDTQNGNKPYVSLNFKSSGAKKFENLTGDNVGKRMAIVMDNNVISAPTIQTRIGGGRAQITLGAGNYNDSLKQAHDLSLVLRAGALPVQLDFLEQRIVGPSLGQDSIIRARYASLVGCALVFIFILIYYKISGVMAIVTLSLNIIFVLAALVGFEATLTLPGIAGIALTIGMAVDANIIIYERIREEIRKGISNYKAVEGGFDQAFWTIIDANITTALAGLCLLNFGTGPIRGFAVTLLIGIVATVYTSYFVGQLLFEFYMNKVEGQDLSI
jgi:preprotein translocase subunit SecD